MTNPYTPIFIQHLMDFGPFLIGVIVLSYVAYNSHLYKLFGPKVYIDDTAVARALMNMGLEKRRSYKDVVLTMSNVNSTNRVKSNLEER
jgi:hypothetical protein